MRLVSTDPVLHELENRVKWHAAEMKRTLPEIRFFILDRIEFASLLEKHVYPTSPVNIWEGKRMVTKKIRIETGQESSLYYEVVQTGNPSYAYLNNTNSAMTQASVMAHVVGHCEFSELNVLQDSTRDRTEYVMHLVRKVNMGQRYMGEKNYLQFWNAAESAVPLIAPHSQYNLGRSIEDETFRFQEDDAEEKSTPAPSLMKPYSHTMNEILQHDTLVKVWEKEQQKKDQKEQLSRKGYRLIRPCQDILGFLRRYAPTSRSEKAILDYMYVSHATHDFVQRTQIMNEGWAMYWEKKIMLELFAEKAVKGIIDYARTFSGVCSPRPFFIRNPYHIGYYLWNHIEELYRDGKISLDYLEETDREIRQNWKKPGTVDPVAAMEHLVKTITDYEFLRRFLTLELIETFLLNRIPKMYINMLGISKDDIIREEQQFVWINPEPVKNEMLTFFTHFHRPRIYLVDTDFIDGGLLLYHRDDKRKLRKDWIRPTLSNINYIWKGAVSLLTGDILYSYSNNRLSEQSMQNVSFEQVLEQMQNSKKPITM